VSTAQRRPDEAATVERADVVDDGSTTVLIGQRVRAGMEDAFDKWQRDVNCAAGDYRGFLGAEITRPTDPRGEWNVVYRFDSVAHVQNWLNSSTRQRYLEQGSKFLDGPATQQVVAGGSQPSDALVTVVVSHRIRDEDIPAFLAWQARMEAAERNFVGFRGSELFRPVEGVQDEWTAMYRYDSGEHLDAWMTSAERTRLLEEGEAFSDFRLRTIDNSFGSWFAFDQHGEPATPPSETKSAIAVWVGLYPTVVILTLVLSPLQMPLWLGLLIGNLLSSFIMSFFTMPRYVNPLLGRWLRPAPDAPQPASNLRGIGLVVALNVAWLAVFILVTRVFWTLP
jgi:antibiotic biosynthesis monooxygenase (ABM) superfamily enzyme